MRTESRSYKRRLARIEADLNAPGDGKPEIRVVFHEHLAAAEKRARAEGRNVRFISLQVVPREITG